jgi:hypothetical protein
MEASARTRVAFATSLGSLLAWNRLLPLFLRFNNVENASNTGYRITLGASMLCVRFASCREN